MLTVFMVWPCALLMVILNTNCKGNWCLCKVNGHFEWFVIMVMRDMLKIFPACVPPMIYATINLCAKCQMIRRVPLQRPKAASKFLNKITWTPTLRARRCGGIPAKVMVLRNSVSIAIAWLSPVSTKFVDKNTCSCSTQLWQSECWESSQLYFLLSEKLNHPCILGLCNWLLRPRKQCGWRYLKMALDGVPSIRQFWLRLRAPCRLSMENDQWWKTLGHCQLSEGTQHTTWRGDRRAISCFSWKSRCALHATN